MAKGFKTGGRQKGTPNKVNALLKDDILQAAEEAHPEGRVGYLRSQAVENPSAFLTLLGKVLPMQLTGADGGPIQTEETGAGAHKLAAFIDAIASRTSGDSAAE